jgi:hypothetical protein
MSKYFVRVRQIVLIYKKDYSLHEPPIQWVPGALSLELKRPGREADHSPPSSAEIKE